MIAHPAILEAAAVASPGALRGSIAKAFDRLMPATEPTVRSPASSAGSSASTFAVDADLRGLGAQTDITRLASCRRRPAFLTDPV